MQRHGATLRHERFLEADLVSFRVSAGSDSPGRVTPPACESTLVVLVESPADQSHGSLLQAFPLGLRNAFVQARLCEC